MMVSRNVILSVSGINRKWYIVVKVNCKCDSLIIFNIMIFCLLYEDFENELRSFGLYVCFNINLFVVCLQQVLIEGKIMSG